MDITAACTPSRQQRVRRMRHPKLWDLSGRRKEWATRLELVNRMQHYRCRRPSRRIQPLRSRHILRRTQSPTLGRTQCSTVPETSLPKLTPMKDASISDKTYPTMPFPAAPAACTAVPKGTKKQAPTKMSRIVMISCTRSDLLLPAGAWCPGSRPILDANLGKGRPRRTTGHFQFTTHRPTPFRVPSAAIPG